MLKIGATDVFEREYTQRFRLFAGQFGEFIAYERDRGAKDIGLHLTRRLRSGEERVSAGLCWFQLKGITKKKFSPEQFDVESVIKLSLKVSHLRYWYLQPMPTYLALFVECADVFLVLNLQKYVEDTWGAQDLRSCPARGEHRSTGRKYTRRTGISDYHGRERRRGMGKGPWGRRRIDTTLSS